MSNERKFWNDVLTALGSTNTVNNEKEFWAEFSTVLGGVTTNTKTEIDGLTSLGGTITGATANDTMTAVADIALSTSDTYTDAAVNSAVNTAIAEIEDNLADLQTKVNAIITALKA